MEKKPLIIITGPTAVGKTALSLKLAEKIGGEIISADSMQVYRRMDIGSAKIMPEEMQGIRHHMIDILEPEEPFNVVLFQSLVKTCLADIYERGKLPILTGGTGFYIQAILYDIDFSKEEEDPAYRTYLEQLAVKEGDAYLHNMLKEVDPAAALQIHEHNQKRVIRALEFHQQTGKKISEHNEAEHQKESAYRSCYFVLNDRREQIYKNIDLRVDRMLEAGLLEEVRKLKERGLHKEMISMQGLGYKEILAFLDGELSLEQAVYLIKRDTRHFAKRQLTWFRREKDVLWVDKDLFGQEEQRMLSYMTEELHKNGIGKESAKHEGQ